MNEVFSAAFNFGFVRDTGTLTWVTLSQLKGLPSKSQAKGKGWQVAKPCPMIEEPNLVLWIKIPIFSIERQSIY